MTYPPAPWHLQGEAIQTIYLIDIDRVRSYIPDKLEIFTVLPGKTICSVYISEYQAGSVLEYNELIVAPALIRSGEKVGAWISHIYVDNLDSVAGGREIWGLPKEMAEFTRTDSGVTVKQEDLTLCTLSIRSNWFGRWKLPAKITGYCFGNLNTDLLYFGNDFQTRVNLINSHLEISANSPFASLQLTSPFLSLNLQGLNVVAGIPEQLGIQI